MSDRLNRRRPWLEAISRELPPPDAAGRSLGETDAMPDDLNEWEKEILRQGLDEFVELNSDNGRKVEAFYEFAQVNDKWGLKSELARRYGVTEGSIRLWLPEVAEYMSNYILRRLADQEESEGD